MDFAEILNRTQYDEYCQVLERLLDENSKGSMARIEALSGMIRAWDEALHPQGTARDPIQLLRSLMKEHGLRNADMADLLGLSKGAMSNILHYRRGLTKEHIRVLAAHFAIQQEALKRPYALK